MCRGLLPFSLMAREVSVPLYQSLRPGSKFALGFWVLSSRLLSELLTAAKFPKPSFHEGYTGPCPPHHPTAHEDLTPKQISPHQSTWHLLPVEQEEKESEKESPHEHVKSPPKSALTGPSCTIHELHVSGQVTQPLWGSVSLTLNCRLQDFPGAPVIKTLISQCRGPRFDP